MSENRIIYWLGRPIDDLSREELIDALTQLAATVAAMRVRHDRDLTLLGGPFEQHPANIRDAG